MTCLQNYCCHQNYRSTALYTRNPDNRSRYTVVEMVQDKRRDTIQFRFSDIILNS